MRNQQKVVKTIAEVAIFAALGFVLDAIQGAYSDPLFPNGGSIGIALACVFIMSFRRGTIAGVATGLIMGLLDLLDGVYVAPLADNAFKAFAQVALDYWIAYPLAGLAGLVRRFVKQDASTLQRSLFICLGCFIGGTLKFLSHFLAGVLFWPSTGWNIESATLFSFVYNLAYTLPCVILSGAIVVLINVFQPKLLVNPDGLVVKKKEN